MKSETKSMRSFLALTLSFTLLWLFSPQIVYATQTKGCDIVVKDRAGRKLMLYKESHALLVGASKYNKGWPKLESVQGEVRKIEQALKRNGFQVHTVMDPTSKALKNAFAGFIDRYGFKKDNRLLFFYSGHGYSLKSPLQGYLVPVDAPDPRISRSGFLRKALSMSQILTWCREMEAKHVLFLFDSCFSGTIFKTRDLPEHPPHISDIAARPVRQFITAGAAGEPVPAKSVFAPSFIRALRGEGDIDKDGYVTGTELGMYLHKKVLGYETGQTPQYGKFNDPDLDEGDFVFQLLRSQTAEKKPSVHEAEKPASTVTTTPQDSIDKESLFWQSIQNSNNPALFGLYLKKFPNGTFADIAKIKIEELKPQKEAAIIAADITKTEKPKEEKVVASISPQSTKPKSLARTAKGEYFEAAACYNKLCKSPKKQKYRHQWLNCIEKFLAVYRYDPSGPWAPAGMFMSGVLYGELYRHSRKDLDRKEALHIFERVLKRFPKSKYSKKAADAIKEIK